MADVSFQVHLVADDAESPEGIYDDVLACVDRMTDAMAESMSVSPADVTGFTHTQRVGCLTATTEIGTPAVDEEMRILLGDALDFLDGLGRADDEIGVRIQEYLSKGDAA